MAREYHSAKKPDMTRKLLIIVFAEDSCRQNHALLYATDLTRRGHEVKLILEGAATRSFGRLDDPMFGRLFAEAKAAGIIAGACKKASGGCKPGDPNVLHLAGEQSVPLLDEMQGHAGIAQYVESGYEIVVI
jgi:hypothetical protein